MLNLSDIRPANSDSIDYNSFRKVHCFTFFPYTATNPSPSYQNAMNVNSEEGLLVMKKRDSICISKYV